MYCWWECKFIQSLWKRYGDSLKKKKGNKTTSNDPAIPPVGIYLEETKQEKDTCTPIFIAALFTMARIWKQPKCPSIEE